ncbi:DNA glycosylase [Podospora didyma]|uniref:Adenine DNA glycosylase n=1 Tax=Podospora didyma TaxID=330526 RepID=A0AAE0K1T0_9PEZI|nr:DNA glycosylase [Podospora didyma]
MATRRQSARIALSLPTRTAAKKRSAYFRQQQEDASEFEDDGSESAHTATDEEAPSIPSDSEPESAQLAKRRKTATAKKKSIAVEVVTSKKNAAPKYNRDETKKICETLFSTTKEKTDSSSSCSATRIHAITYHRPLLLSSAAAREALLSWFDSVSTTRAMPWRMAWVDPTSYHQDKPSDLRKVLERRAYEVWISEIMLQQTRVAVVIGYWTRWMAKWPTIHDLAAAPADDVLSVWQGLGYYSRATRIHQGAKLVCADPEMKGMLPQGVAELEAKVPGVGRYTAGAISAIVYGHAAPMVDGNVLRVLSRQLGILGDVKTDRRTIDVLWAAADALVKAVAQDGDGVAPSDRPGRWGQALMELGSTVCAPKPNCSQCPITATCRAYAEGEALAQGVSAKVEDIEDLCSICAPFEEAEEDDDAVAAKNPVKRGSKQQSLSSFFFTGAATTKPSKAPTAAQTMETTTSHARKFPLRKPKKQIRAEEILVCAIRRTSDSRYLIHRRPEKGLLAGLWEFPSHILPDSNDSTAKERKAKALSHVEDLIADGKKSNDNRKAAKKSGGLKYMGELGSVPWVFSHLKLTMHVHLFEHDDLDAVLLDEKDDTRKRWASSDDLEAESMGTGMRKCWTLVKESG